MRRPQLFISLLAALALAPIAACNGSSAGDGSGSGTNSGTVGETGTGEEGTVPSGSQASDLAIAKVSINQGVEVTLNFNNEDLSELNTGLVANRKALVRVFVAPLPGFSEREIQGILTLEGDQGTTTYESIVTVAGLSNDAELASTFSFEVPPEDLPGDQQMSVALYEVGDASFDGDTSQTSWPSDGSSYAAPFESVGPLRITLVPVQYDADGSGRLPDVSEAQIQLYQDLLDAMYPVPGVELSVADPFPWGSAVAGNGQGWQQLLLAIVGLRGTLGLASDEYIYGLFNGADSFMEFCNFGCVAGLSLVAENPGDAMARSSIGVGFGGIDSVLTLAHELGHAHGRAHAPCMLFGQPSDPGYPYPEAVLGTWGWDGVAGELKDPDAFTDIMGYCKPNWISDYTYDALLSRSIAVNALGMDEGPLRAWSSLWIDAEGQATTPVTTLELALPRASSIQGQSERHTARFLDRKGELIAEHEARYYPADHLPGGLLLWPAAPDQAQRVEVEGLAALTL